jgi:hypothetical protein
VIAVVSPRDMIAAVFKEWARAGREAGEDTRGIAGHQDDEGQFRDQGQKVGGVKPAPFFDFPLKLALLPRKQSRKICRRYHAPHARRRFIPSAIVDPLPAWFLRGT